MTSLNQNFGCSNIGEDECATPPSQLSVGAFFQYEPLLEQKERERKVESVQTSILTLHLEKFERLRQPFRQYVASLTSTEGAPSFSFLVEAIFRGYRRSLFEEVVIDAAAITNTTFLATCSLRRGHWDGFVWASWQVAGA